MIQSVSILVAGWRNPGKLKKSVVFKYQANVLNSIQLSTEIGFPLCLFYWLVEGEMVPRAEIEADIPGLLASLRQVGDSIWSKASAASIVLSVQCTLLPWTDASTAGGYKKKLWEQVTYRRPYISLYNCTSQSLTWKTQEYQRSSHLLYLPVDRNI